MRETGATREYGASRGLAPDEAHDQFIQSGA